MAELGYRNILQNEAVDWIQEDKIKSILGLNIYPTLTSSEGG